MAFKLAGRFIAISQIKTVASADPSKQPMKKRELYMDCTRFDGITGEQIGKENKVVLEFGGDKVLEKLESLKMQKDDIISVDFDIQGSPYNDKTTGKMRVFTGIRCFDCNIIRRAGEQMVLQPQAAAPAPQPAPEPQPAPAPEPQQQASSPTDNPFYGAPISNDDPNGGLPF